MDIEATLLVELEYFNPANPEIHRSTTGPEIWNDTDGNIAYFVAGVATGKLLAKKEGVLVGVSYGTCFSQRKVWRYL